MKNILYTRFFNDNIKEDVNVILSPQFYWIKKIDIPIKSLNEAKKIAQNYFDLKGNYFFDALKIKDTFFVIAIDKNLELKIDKKYIKSIKIAQNELYEYDTINLNDNHQLKKIDDILFCFPSNTPDKPHINDILDNIKLSKQNINIFNAIEIDKNTIFLLSFIFILLSTTLVGLTYSYKQQQKNINIQNLQKYNLPLTNIQLNSILKNLKNIQYNDLLLKKDLKFFTKTPLKKNEKYISLEKTIYGFKIKIKTKQNLNYYFKQRFNIKKFNIKNSIYEVELSHG